MNVIFSILITIASVLLIGVVLIQKSKGGGLASSASGLNQIGGVRQTTNFVEKATWSLAIFICVLSICACLFTSKVVSNAKAQAIDFSNTQTEQTQGTPMETPQQAPAQK